MSFAVCNHYDEMYQTLHAQQDGTIRRDQFYDEEGNLHTRGDAQLRVKKLKEKRKKEKSMSNEFGIKKGSDRLSELNVEASIRKDLVRELYMKLVAKAIRSNPTKSQIMCELDSFMTQLTPKITINELKQFNQELATLAWRVSFLDAQFGGPSMGATMTLTASDKPIVLRRTRGGSKKEEY